MSTHIIELTLGPRCQHGCYQIKSSTEAVWYIADVGPVDSRAEEPMTIHGDGCSDVDDADQTTWQECISTCYPGDDPWQT